jgi:AhpD family alkylhydroperoxidase
MTDYVVPTSRLDAYAEAPDAYKSMLGFARAAGDGLDRKIVDLVLIRASQLNGCAFCVDMHTRDAVKHGDDQRRINNVPTWPESPLFTAKERAALALTEAITLLTQGHVPDEVWQRAEKEFDPAELSRLVLTVAAINALNRVGVATRLIPPVSA